MEYLIEILKALADETRMKILKLLLTHDLCVAALAKSLNLSESAISQQLQILRKAGAIKGEKRGYYTHYSVDRKVLKDLGLELDKLASLIPEGEHKCGNIQQENNQNC